MDHLEAVIEPGALVLTDTSVVLAYLSGAEQASTVAAIVFDDFVAAGRNTAVISAVTVTETLVRPFQVGPSEVAIVEAFLGHFPGIRIIDVGFDIARAAARLRAASSGPGRRPRLAVPDSIIVATALQEEAGVLVTNDTRWRSLLSELTPDLSVVYLEDYVTA
ncbi:MAG TPA: PIN domain-containing protein [Candidatus Limnocylindrales bacterium]|nr:PIN domain-containing protein [Candidatus Limnocylindrales bacterium]